MKRALVVASVALLGAAFVGARSHAGPETPGGTAAAASGTGAPALLPASGPSGSAGAPASARPGGDPKEGAAPEGLEAVPQEKSPPPKAAEWAAAGRVRFSRIGHAAVTTGDCRAYRVREWIKVRCPKLRTAAASLIAGTAAGVSLWIDPPPDPSTEVPGAAEVIFPARVGDRRIVELTTFGPGYAGPLTVLPALVLQEHWVEGESAPTITIL